MNVKDVRALERLTQKLTALRKTLRADERNFLDQMVIGANVGSEVAMHRLDPKLDPAVEPRLDPALDQKMDPQLDPKISTSP